MSNQDSAAPTVLLELDELLDKFKSGTASRVEVGRLEDLLSDDLYLEAYVHSMGMDLMLKELLAADESEELGAGAISPPGRWRWIAVAAAILLLAVLWVSWSRSSGERKVAPVAKPEPEGPPALVDRDTELVLVGMTGVRWAEAEPWQIEGGVVIDGPVTFESGLLELSYPSGVRLILEGPAQLEATGPLSARLDHGRCYVEVPPQAKGFRIDYAGHTVVDHGTEFVVTVPRDGAAAEVAVLRGEVEVFPASDRHGVRLRTHDAVRHHGMAELETIPFEPDSVVRELPGREFGWSLSGQAHREFRFDVTGLVRKGGSYRVIFKWMSGPDALIIEEVALFRDDEQIAEDFHVGQTGDLRHVKDNLYRLDVPERDSRSGSWELRAKVHGYHRYDRIADTSEGILYFEENPAAPVSPKMFVGTWSYQHNGVEWVRDLQPNGTVRLLRDGKPEPVGIPLWEVEDGIMRITFPLVNQVEYHLLRDPKTMLFLSRPYRNATKEAD